MNRRQIPMFLPVILLPLCGVSIALWIMMGLGPGSTILFFAIVSVVAFTLVVETLVRNLPKQLQEMASANSIRFDGSSSSRRTKAESKAIRKLRSDLWALCLICGLLLGLGGAAIHFLVVPIPVAVRGLSAFQLDPGEWKSAMKSAGVDSDLEKSIGKQLRISPRDANAKARTLWQVAPLMIAGAVLYGFGVIYIASRGYSRALAEYHSGIVTRQARAAERDIAAIQRQQELADYRESNAEA